MKNNNNKKRWFYDLTEKQVYKIVAIFEVIFFIILICIAIDCWPIWTNEQLLSQKGMDMTTAIIHTIVLIFCLMVALGLFLWMILWENPEKQFYLFKKEHDEKIVPKVREKFGLSSDFKEVLFKSENYYHYYAKESEGGILVSIRDDNGKELKSKLIENYNYFDLNYKPKV